MGELSYNSVFITRYLLGDLSPAEQETFEEIFFIDNDLFIELLDTKDRLIHDYLSDRLSVSDRTRFEQYFLAIPEHRRDIEVASCFQITSERESLTERPSATDPNRSWWREIFITLDSNRALASALATAMVVLVVMSVWSVIRSQKARPEIGSSAHPSIGSSVFILELSAGTFRGEGQIPEVTLGKGLEVVALRLDVGTADYSNYRANLLRRDLRPTPIFESDSLKSEKISAVGSVVLWEIPANRLQKGTYQVKLSAINAAGLNEDIGSYYFNVSNK